MLLIKCLSESAVEWNIERNDIIILLIKYLSESAVEEWNIEWNKNEIMNEIRMK